MNNYQQKMNKFAAKIELKSSCIGHTRAQKHLETVKTSALDGIWHNQSSSSFTKTPTPYSDHYLLSERIQLQTCI